MKAGEAEWSLLPAPGAKYRVVGRPGQWSGCRATRTQVFDNLDGKRGQQKAAIHWRLVDARSTDNPWTRLRESATIYYDHETDWCLRGNIAPAALPFR